jgi:hypothetical protein
VHPVILGQARLPQSLEKAGPIPVLKVLMHRASRTELSRQCFPLDAGAQNVNNRRKNLPIRHRFAPSSSIALVLSPGFPLSRWDQRLNLAPQLIGNCPRLDLGHIENIFARSYRRDSTDFPKGIHSITIYG